jgi:rhodanese-related sulfurtransferase
MPLAPQMVKPQELASWIKAKENIQVIDVRDDDYEGGAIVDHVHVPSAKFADQVANVVCF